MLRVTPEVKESGVKCRRGGAGVSSVGRSRSPGGKGAASAGKPGTSTALQKELEWTPWVAEARVKASELNLLEAERGGGPRSQMYKNRGSPFRVEGSRSSAARAPDPKNSCPVSPSPSLPAAVTWTVIRCRRQVPGKFLLSLARPLTAAPAASHQTEHTSETRLMRSSPDR